MSVATELPEAPVSVAPATPPNLAGASPCPEPSKSAKAAEAEVADTSHAPGYTRIELCLGALALIATVAALYLGRGFFVPLLIGMLVSYALKPVVDAIERVHIPRAIAAALVLAILAGGTGWMGYSLSDEATVMIEKLPEASRKLRLNMRTSRSEVPSALQNVQEAANELQAAATDASTLPVPAKGTRAAAAPAAPAAPAFNPWVRDYALAQSALLASIAAQAPIVLLLAYFLLASGDHFRRKLIQFVGPSLSRKKDALSMLGEIDSQVQHYLFAMLVSNALIALTTWLAFEALGVEQAGVWGVVAGVLHFIPYLGSLILGVATGVAAFLQFGTPLHALGIAMTALLATGVIGLVFMPWLQSRFAGVNAAVLFIALLFFGWLWGVAGLLLGGPLIAIVKVVCDRVDSLKRLGGLIGK